MINLDNRKSKGTHWVSLFIDRNTAVYFNSFGIEYIPHEVLNKIKDKSVTHNIYRIQVIKSIIEYIIAGKTLLNYTNLLSPNNYKKKDKIMYKYFKDKYGGRSKSRV